MVSPFHYTWSWTLRCSQFLLGAHINMKECSGQHPIIELGTFIIETRVNKSQNTSLSWEVEWLTALWNSEGVVLKDFLEKRITVNSDNYIEILTTFARRIKRVRIPNETFFNTTTPGLTHMQQRKTQFSVWIFQCCRIHRPDLLLVTSTYP